MRRNGWSLLEVLVSCFLLAVVFGAAMVLLNQSVEVLRYSQGHDNVMAALETGLERMSSEARQMVHVALPAVGTPAPGGPDLQFVKVDASQAAVRLPEPLPVPLPSAWNKDDPTQELSVHYHLDAHSQTLLRDVSPASGGTAQVQSVCGAVASFSSFWQNGALQIVVVVQVNKIQSTFTTQVVCPVLQ